MWVGRSNLVVQKLKKWIDSQSQWIISPFCIRNGRPFYWWIIIMRTCQREDASGIVLCWCDELIDLFHPFCALFLLHVVLSNNGVCNGNEHQRLLAAWLSLIIRQSVASCIAATSEQTVSLARKMQSPRNPYTTHSPTRWYYPSKRRLNLILFVDVVAIAITQTFREIENV